MITKGRNHISRKLSFYLMAGTIITLSGASAPAHAGFNWTPPPPPPKASPAPDAMATPLPPPVEAEAVPAAVPATVAATETVNWMPAVPAPQETVAAAAPPPVYKEVRGFGKDIPLSMAVTQIVPADYTASFASDVNTGALISWQGDRPWNVILRESLEPAGLVAVIDNNSVKIEKWTDGSAGSWSSAPAPAAAMAPQRYTPEQLAAIGADNTGYRPSYPRHRPHRMLAGSSAATDSQKSGDSWQPSSNETATARDASPASAPGQPTQLADKMQQQEPAPAPASSSGMTWQPAPDTAGMAWQSAPAPAAVEQRQANAPSGVANINMVTTWQAEKGHSLHDTLSAWCGQSGVNLIWEAKKDYRLPKDMDTKGTFTDAVLNLLTVYNSAKPRPVGQLHPNLPDGPPVLVIATEAGA